MNTTGRIVDQIMDEVNETDTTVYRPKVVKATSKAYLDVAGEHWWNALMKKVEITVSADATVLPSDLVKIKSVIGTDGSIYYNSQFDGRIPQHAYVWYHDTSVQIPSILKGRDGTTCVATNASKTVTFSGGVLPSAIDGEFIMVGAHEGIYEIDSRDSDTQLTLVEDYRGVTETVAEYQIRPVGTPTISLAEARTMNSAQGQGSVNAVTGTVIITYLSKPLPLTEDFHIIPIPNDADPVFVKGLQTTMRRRGWGRAAGERQKDYDLSLGKAKRLEPTYKEDIKPKSMFRRQRSSYSSLLPNLQGG